MIASLVEELNEMCIDGDGFHLVKEHTYVLDLDNVSLNLELYRNTLLASVNLDFSIGASDVQSTLEEVLLYNFRRSVSDTAVVSLGEQDQLCIYDSLYSYSNVRDVEEMLMSIVELASSLSDLINGVSGTAQEKQLPMGITEFV